MSAESKEYNDQLFMILVMNFQSSALINMGKIVNPLTEKTARNLAEAQFSIDMIDMLVEKTKGNLSKKEESNLQKILTELRLNYIDELKKEETEKKEKAQEKEGEKKPEEKKEAGTENSETETNKSEKKEDEEK